MNKGDRYTPQRATMVCALTLCLLALLAFSAPHVGAGGKSPLPVTAELTNVQSTSFTADILTKGKWAEISTSNQIFPTRDVPVHISVLPNGKLLYWGRDKADLVNNNNPSVFTPDGLPDWDEQGKCNTYIWDPLFPDEANISSAFKDTYMKKPNSTTNLFCSGHSFLQDGTLLVAGGHKRHFDPTKPDKEGIGEDALNIFDYRTGTWSLLRDAANNPIKMTHGRWYPYNLTLASGETIIMSGTYLDGTDTNFASVYLNTTPDILGLTGVLRRSAYDDPVNGGSNLDREIYSTYPRIFLAPDGRVFYPGAPGNDTYTRFLNTQVTPNVWSAPVATMRDHDVGSAVMYAPGKVAMMGGHHSTAFAEPVNGIDLFDMGSSTAWTPTTSMTYARNQMKATLLPDGKVLAVGGTQCSGTNEIQWNLNHEIDSASPPCVDGQVLTPELWTPPDMTNPAGALTLLAPLQELRVYHSTSILMPDGRVLVGGGGLPVAGGEYVNGFNCYGEDAKAFRCRTAGHRNFEIFSPPYLYEPDGSGGAKDAVRPVIVSAPDNVAYGDQFFVDVGDANPSTDIAKVVLLHLPSVTHGFDQDQRRVELVSQPRADGRGLTVTAPADGRECPPGQYMMFLIRNNGRGTPSVAKIIRVGSFSIDRTSDTFHSAAVSPATSLSTQISVKAPAGQSWTATVNASATSWVTITSGSSGTGNGFINYTVSSNTTPDPVTHAVPTNRSATISIRLTGQRFTSLEFNVYQAANFDDVVYPPSPSPTGLYDSISRIYARGVTLGCGNNRYCPGDPVTRAQMAAFLARALGFQPTASSAMPTPVSTTSMFADVPVSSSSHQYIDFIRRLGVTNGCATNPLRFCPDGYVTRAEMATFMIRALGIKNLPTPTTQTFTDVLPTYWAAANIEEAARRQIALGFGDHTFRPETLITREQMAAFLTRAFKY